MTQRRTNSFTTALSRRGFLAGSAALAFGTHASLAAQDATPVDDALAPFAERIGAILAMAPARELSPDAPLAFYHADLERQMRTVDIELPDPNIAPTHLPERYYEASLALPLAAEAYVKGLMPEWFDTFGYNPFGVHQAITLNVPPDVLTIFLADFDVAAIEATLEQSGYEQVQQDESRYWTVGADLDLDSMVGRLGVGMMNHAFVGPGALAFAQQESIIQEVAQVTAGVAPSMVEQEIWPGMARLFSPDTVGLIPVSPTLLMPAAPTSSDRFATPVQGDNTGIAYLAFGVRAGSVSKPLSLVGEGTPEATPVSPGEGVPAHVEVRIGYHDPAMATEEATTIADRWEELDSQITGQPYSQLMTLDDARVHDKDASVVAVDFTSDIPNRWIQMVQTRDLLPFVPATG